MSAKLIAKYGLYQNEKAQNKYVVIIDSQYYKQYLAEISELFIKYKTLQHILLCYAVKDILS